MTDKPNIKPQKMRRAFRAKPDPTDYVQIDLNADRDEFVFEHVALLVEEAPMSGCGIACLLDVGLKKGMLIKVQVGRLSPLKAEIMWVREFDGVLGRYGLKFLD